MPGIFKFGEYLANLTSASDFSGPKLLEIMASFQTPFEEHMRSEISTIAQLAQHPRTPKEGSAEEEATRALYDRVEGMSLMKSGITDVMPFFLFNFDREYEDRLWASWPPIPAPVRWVLMGMARVLHPGWWKFASCDAAGRRVEFYAVPSAETRQ
jgi:hypothetical protein